MDIGQSRPEIRIGVIGCQGVGRETFAKALFLDKSERIRVNPLNKLHETYYEIDVSAIQTAIQINSKCKKQNSSIMGLQTVNTINDLCLQGIDPFLYRTVPRLMDFQGNDNEPVCDPSIFLTTTIFHDTTDRSIYYLQRQNIIILILDANYGLTHSEAPLRDTDLQLMNSIMDLISKSENDSKAHLITILNKCDVVDQDTGDATVHRNVQTKVDEEIRILAKNYNIHQYVHPCTPMSLLLASIYRNVAFAPDGFNMLNDEDKKYIEHMAYSNNPYKKMDPIKYVTTNYDDLIKLTGYNGFVETINGLLTDNAIAMVERNYLFDLASLTSNVDYLHSNPEDFIETLSEKISCAKKFSKILKHHFMKGFITKFNLMINEFYHDYESTPTECMRIVNLVESAVTDTGLKKDDLATINKTITDIKNRLTNKAVVETETRLYSMSITSSNYLPSNVHPMCDFLRENMTSVDSHVKLTTHILNLYSRKDVDQNLIYKVLFDPLESTILSSLLKSLQKTLQFELYKEFVIKILLNKLRIAGLAIDWNLESKLTASNYCRCLRTSLTPVIKSKYEYFFNNIVDLCHKIYLNGTTVSEQLIFIEENLFDRKIGMNNFDHYLISTIKHRDYEAMIADNMSGDEDDGEEDDGEDDEEEENDDEHHIQEVGSDEDEIEEIDDEDIYFDIQKERSLKKKAVVDI